MKNQFHTTKNLLFFSVVLSLFILSSIAQADWEKTFGGAGDDRGRSVAETSDLGYIIVGYTGSYDVYLIKTDRDGNLDPNWPENPKRFGGEGYDLGFSVAETSDLAYIIAGETSSFGAEGRDVYLIKTDALGNELWHKTFGEGDYDFGYSVSETSDLGYIIAGTTESLDASWEVYLIKTDVEGNLDPNWPENPKTFGGEGYDRGYSVVETSDLGYIIAGDTYSFGAGGSDVYLVKTDAEGNLDPNWPENPKTFGGTNDDHGRSVSETSDLGYIIAGSTKSFGAGGHDVYLIRLEDIEVVCKTDKPVYNPWESVQVLADVDNPGDAFDTNLLGGVIVFRTPPKKPFILTGEVVTETIDPGTNPDILLYEAPPIVTVIAPKGTHGAFCVLYTDDKSILEIDACAWGLEPPEVAQEKFFEDLIRSYIDKYGLENLINANAEDALASPRYIGMQAPANVPSQTALGNAFPNAANPETWIPFQLSESGEVKIQIYNASGQLVKSLHLGYKDAGYYLNKEKAAFWDGKNDRGERVASGIYFYTMQTRNFTATGKVVVLK